MTEELIITQLHDGIGELVLNRAAKRNSLTGPLVDALDAGVRQLSADGNCRVIILRGNEGYFCAGLDLKAFAEEPPPEWRAHFQDDWIKLHNDIYNCPKPVLGALEGFAIAGGSALALACDFLVVGKQSFLHVAEVEMGRLAPINLAWLSIRFSHSLGLKMAVLGQRYYGDDLVSMGIAHQAVEDGEVVKVTRELGRRLADFDQPSVQSLKASLRRAHKMDNFLQVLGRINIA